LDVPGPGTPEADAGVRKRISRRTAITFKLFKARTFWEHGSMINRACHVIPSFLDLPMVNSVADASTLAPSQMSSATARPSLLSRILHILVPCISPQSTTHTVELDSQPIPKSLQEKLESKPTVHTDEVVRQDTAPFSPPSLPSEPPKPTLVSPSPSRPLIPLPSDPVEEVVPIPTTHVLPEDETAGMTSGAVQLPGSKGDSPTAEKPPLTVGDGDDSEGTSYTEEDIDEQDDDEDRLIFNGGAGIPTGPVSSSRPCPRLHPFTAVTGRSSQTPPSPHIPASCRSEMSCT
jgi:hypothetical protein